MLYKKMAEAQHCVGPSLPLQPSSFETGNLSHPQSQHPRVVECHDEDDERQAGTQSQYPNHTTTSTPNLGNTSRVNLAPNLHHGNDNGNYSSNPGRLSYPNPPEMNTPSQQLGSTPFQYPTQEAPPSAASSSSAPPQSSNADTNIPLFQQFIQQPQQQQQLCYNMNDEALPQSPYQIPPPSRPASSSSLSIQVQMMMEDLINQQSQVAQSYNQLSSGLGNGLFPMGGTGSGNGQSHGTIVDEEYPIVE